MKNLSILLRFLLLALTFQVAISPSFGQRLKNDITHLRVIGDDKSLTNQCEDQFLATENLLVKVTVAGLELEAPDCDDHCPLPIACVPMHVAAYNNDTGDFLGVSAQISDFSLTNFSQICHGDFIVGPPSECPLIYFTQVAIPINLLHYCDTEGACQSITIHYELVTPNIGNRGHKLWVPYTEVADAQGCSQILFPPSCFCHYEGNTPVSEPDKALQEIKYICLDAAENPDSRSTSGTSTNVQPLGTITSQDLVKGSLETRDQSPAKIYPNPIGDFFVVDLPNKYDKGMVVQLLDGKGNIVLSRENIQVELGKQLRLDTANLPAGLYFCRISDGKSITSYKIVKTQ